MLVGMILETLGVGLVVPALALMVQPEVTLGHLIFGPRVADLGRVEPHVLVIFGMLGFVAVYAVKSIFLAFLAWRQMGFVFDVQADLSHRLFNGYLHQPYIFHLQRNSAQLINNVVNEVNLLTHSGLIGAMTLLTEMLVLAGITVLMLAIEPIGTILVAAILGVTGWLFNRLTLGRIYRWGQARQQFEGMRLQHLQQGLGGIKDVKLFGRESDFLSRFEENNRGSAHMGRNQKTLAMFPRLWLEFLAVTGNAVLVIVMVLQGKPMADLLPTIGLFAAAAFRLIPSANRVINAVQSVRYSLPVLDTVYNEIRIAERVSQLPADLPIPFKSRIVLDQVVFRYPQSETDTLHDVSLAIAKGSSIGFIGESGAGKSTLVDVILGLLTPSGGSVQVDGVDIQQNLRGWQNQIGYVPQSIYLTDDSLRRNVAFGLPVDKIDEQAVWEALAAAQLKEFVLSLPEGLDTVVGERGVRLSGGQRQRIGIARALYHDPPVLVFDEATSALDNEVEREVTKAIAHLHGKKTILVIAHRLSTVEHCDHIVRLEKGRIAGEGLPSDILAIHNRK